MSAESRLLYNLLVTRTKEAWEAPFYDLGRARYLEHTEQDLVDQFKALDAQQAEFVRSIPSLFAYESALRAPAKVGWISKLEVYDRFVRIYPQFDPQIEVVSPETLQARRWDLGMTSDWEIDRTHWAIKAVDLLDALAGFPNRPVPVPPYQAAAPRLPLLGDKAFVVHGRDENTKVEVANFLRGVGVEPIILHDRPNKGRTLITKFQEESADAKFAVVVMTPDDLGGLDGSAQQRRARQNVILELGFFLGKLGSANVCSLVIDDLEKPSDFEGVVYIRYGSDGVWRKELHRELEHAGVQVQPLSTIEKSK